MPRKARATSASDAQWARDIGYRIRAEREKLKKSSQDFALVGGCSHAQQYRIEAGERVPDALYLLRLREQLWVDINALLTGKEERRDVGYTLEDCIEAGVDYVDAASGDEVVRFALDQAKAKRLRREKEEEERKRAAAAARTPREDALLANWRAASEEGKKAIEVAAKAMAQVAAVALKHAAQPTPATRSSRRRTTASGSHSIAAGGNVVVVNHK